MTDLETTLAQWESDAKRVEDYAKRAPYFREFATLVSRRQIKLITVARKQREALEIAIKRIDTGIFETHDRRFLFEALSDAERILKG